MSSAPLPLAKIAIVTGASSGIGRAIALRLASDGLDIGLNDIPSKSDELKQVEREIQAMGRRAVVFTGDVADEAQVKTLVSVIAEALGGLDVMVANAGVASRGGVLSCTADDWDRVMNINARGTFLCYKYAAEQMIKQGASRGGRIIGAASSWGKRGSKEAVAYSMSKFAVRGLTQSAADELGQYNITVNAYAPGWIDTSMTRLAGAPHFQEGAYLEMKKKDSVVGRNGQPEEVAGLVSYLVSDVASFVTGQSLCINGGAYFD
ncbi:acetoin reductase family protein [Pterulicium gracile]|uniref:Acetoin reductase family protein n=1 Tax=Pterulicium gracile TaxID=1884261 RepID=A0A5C3Q6U1_9AGAR|nr:acetoin reductase family protein [Pterula gracilis]